MLLGDQHSVLVADCTALADTSPIRLLDAHPLSACIGFGKHWIVGLSVFFGPGDISELCACQSAVRYRPVNGPSRGGSLHVGFWFHCVPHPGDLPHDSAPRKRTAPEREAWIGEVACNGPVSY